MQPYKKQLLSERFDILSFAWIEMSNTRPVRITVLHARCPRMRFFPVALELTRRVFVSSRGSGEYRGLETVQLTGPGGL